MYKVKAFFDQCLASHTMICCHFVLAFLKSHMTKISKIFGDFVPRDPAFAGSSSDDPPFWKSSRRRPWGRGCFLSYLIKISLSVWCHHLANLHTLKTWISLKRKEGRTGVFSWCVISCFYFPWNVNLGNFSSWLIINRNSWFYHFVLRDFWDASPPNG